MNPNKFRIELADNNKGSEKMTFSNSSTLDTVIKVIGVGNGGCNAVNRMIEEGLENVDFIAMNTDSQALSRSNAPITMVLGDRITQGLGAGTDPEKGAEAAREDIAKIEEVVNGANLVFIASSFGGGTGTGASPVVAEAAKKAGALTIGVVTKPFEYEGKLKMSRAEAGISKMLTVVDSLIIIPNENLYDMVDMDNYSYEQALSVVDDILRQGVQGISDIITQTGFVNVDFADVKTMISLSNGRAHLGIGVGKGDDRLNKAINNAFENPLLDVSSIKNARGILANIVCPKDFAMKEYREASKTINNYANENANIKIGVCPKEDLKDEIIVTIVATGFDANSINYGEEKNNDYYADDIINKNASLNNSNNINNNLINNNVSNSNDIINKNVSFNNTNNINNNSDNITISHDANTANINTVSEEKNNESYNKTENIIETNNVNNDVKIAKDLEVKTESIAINDNKENKENFIKENHIKESIDNKENDVNKDDTIDKEEQKLSENITIDNSSSEKVVEESVKKEHKEVENNEEIKNEDNVKSVSEEKDNINLPHKEEKEYVEELNKKDEVLSKQEETSSEKSSFESKINAIKKPIIAKNRFVLNHNAQKIEEEEIIKNKMDEEMFNRNVVNDAVANDAKKIAVNNEAVKKIAEQMRFEDEEEQDTHSKNFPSRKTPFDIVSDEYMDKHSKLGSKMSIFGESLNQETDLEKPAFLRRQIQARNIR